MFIRFEDAVTFDHLVKCYKHCRKGKSKRLNVVIYHINYLWFLLRLFSELVAGKYVIKDLYSFIIYEPKKRAITANQFEDKIVQRLICEYVLRPVLQNRLIYDNYASQPDKGTHLALHRLQKFMRCYAKDVNWDLSKGGVLVCDITKFFYTIDRNVCYEQVKALPIDKKLKKLIRDQIWACGPEYNEYTDDPDRGLCIGFQTSQWLAVYYLDGLDHLIKEELHIKYYGRYMDDFYLIHEDVEYLEYCYVRINQYITGVLHLTLNKKSHIHPISQGVCFLGYHCTYNMVTHEVETVVRSKSIKRMLKRAKKHKNLIALGKIKESDADMALNSWHAYAVHGNSEKAINAYNMAREMIHPHAYELAAYEWMQMNPKNVDPEGFTILKYGEDFRDQHGFQKLIHHVESKEEFDERVGTVYIHENKYMRAWRKHQARILDTKIAVRDAAEELECPAELSMKPKKKKKNKTKKKDKWKNLDIYRDKDGFIQLKRTTETQSALASLLLGKE